MAFPAFTVTAAYAGSQGARDKSQAIIGKLVWQEAPSSGVVSTNFAPPVNDAAGMAVFRCRATADSWLSYGKSPDSNGSVRVPIPANTDIDVYPDVGDKFMWQAA